MSARKQQGWEQDEFVIVAKDGIEIRTDTFPKAACYVRIVDTRPEDIERELMYWVCDEWQADDEDCSCIGAIFAVIGEVARGDFDPEKDIYQRHADTDAFHRANHREQS